MKVHVLAAFDGVPQLKGVSSILAQAPCVPMLSHRGSHQCVDQANKGVWWIGKRWVTIREVREAFEFPLQRPLETAVHFVQ